MAEEPVFAAFAVAHVAEAVADHEGAAVEDAEGAFRQAPSPRSARAGGRAVGGLVGAGHDIDVAVLGDPCAAVARGDAPEAPDGRGHRGLVLDEEAGPAVTHQLAGRARGESDHGGAAGQRLDHHHPERLLPADRHQQRARAGERRALERPADLTEEADTIAVDVRRDLAVEEVLLARLDDAGEHERHAGRARRGDRAVRPLLGGHPADPEHVVLLALLHAASPAARSGSGSPQRRAAPAGALARCARLIATSVALDVVLA